MRVIKDKKPKGATIKDIMAFGPCDRYPEERLRELVMKSCGKIKRVYAEDVLRVKLDKPDDYAWLLFRPEFIGERTLHQIAIFCWEKIARPIWEKNYPNDKRPHDAVEVKKLWLDGKASDEELDAARAAAMAAARAAAYKKILTYVKHQIRRGQ